MSSSPKWHIDYRARLLAEGLCPSHRYTPVLPGKTKCQVCVDSAAKRRADAKAQGMCTGHTNTPALPGKTKCQVCVDKTADYDRANGSIYSNVRRARKLHAPNEPVLRREVLVRDNWTCRHCGTTLTMENGEADHIIPLILGGPHMYWNHQALCRACNRGDGGKFDDIHKEPRLAHLIHLPIRKLIEAFAREQGATLPRSQTKAKGPTRQLLVGCIRPSRSVVIVELLLR